MAFLTDFQFSGPQFIYPFMNTFKYGGYRPHTPAEMLIGVIFAFFGHFLDINTLSILIATVDMCKGILPGPLNWKTISERLKAKTFFICRYNNFSFYEQLKFRGKTSSLAVPSLCIGLCIPLNMGVEVIPRRKSLDPLGFEPRTPV